MEFSLLMMPGIVGRGLVSLMMARISSRLFSMGLSHGLQDVVPVNILQHAHEWFIARFGKALVQFGQLLFQGLVTLLPDRVSLHDQGTNAHILESHDERRG